MKAEEKYKIGMFKNVHPDVMKFIHENSNIVCPFGKYDNTLVCSQTELIRLVNPVFEQIEKERDNFKLALARVKQLELDREIQLTSFAKWFFDSDYYTPRHGKPFGARRAVEEFLTQTKEDEVLPSGESEKD